jgi:hypothetical protein
MPAPPTHPRRPDRRCSSGPSLFWTVFWGNEDLARAGAVATATTWAGTLPAPADLQGSYGGEYLTLEWDEGAAELSYQVQIRCPAYGHPLAGQEWLGAAGFGFGDEFGHWVWHGSAQHPAASNEFRVRAYWWDPLDGSYYASLDWVTVSVSPGGDSEDMPGEVGDFELAAVNPVTASSVTLVWDDVAGESAYDLSYVTASDTRTPYSIRWWDTSPEDANNRRLEADVTQHTFSGLTAGTTYHFVLQALGGGPDDSYRTESHVVSATTLESPLPAPSHVGARAAPDHWGIQLRWQDNSLSEAQFVIERRDGHAGEFQPLTTVDGNVTSYTDTTVQMGAEYQYRVSARRGELESWGSVSGFVGLAAPLVSIEADVDTCSEFKGDWGQFKLERSGGSLSRYYALEMIGLSLNGSSTATQNDWDEPSLLVLTIPAGRTELYVPVWPKADEVVELDEMMILNVSATSYHHYQADPASAVLAIQERDLIDIDSDNCAGFGLPPRTKYEDWIEERQPGKVLFTNDDDGDADGVADCLDGYNRDNSHAAGHTADDTPPTQEQGERFARVVLLIPTGVNVNNAWFQISYDQWEPRGGTSGLLRIWTKDGNSARDWRNFKDGGDFVCANAPDEHYTWTNFTGTFPWVSDGHGGFKAELYLEAVTVGSGTITMGIDPDGAANGESYLTDTVAFFNGQVAIVHDSAGAYGLGLHVIDATDPVAEYTRIGHWGADTGANSLDGYYNPGDPLPAGAAVGQVRNQVGVPNANPALAWDNFIDRDPDRFYVRVIDPLRNKDPLRRERIKISVGTRSETGGEHDNQTYITLRETGNNTGVFVSESQLLTAPNLTLVAAAQQDDGFPVMSAMGGRAVPDNELDDRTHWATIDDLVRLQYGMDAVRRQTPVSRRGADDDRRQLDIRVRVHNEPFVDTNANGTYDLGEPFVDFSGDLVRNTVLGSLEQAADHVAAQVLRANIAWAQAGIKINHREAIIFEDAPKIGGIDVLADGIFHLLPARDDVAAINSISAPPAAPAGATPTRVEVVFTGTLQPPPGAMVANGYTRCPANQGAALPLNVRENTYVFLGPRLDLRYRTLAHELGHALTNLGDMANAPAVFFPSTVTPTDDLVTTRRRITHTTQQEARTPRAPGNLGAIGNRLLHP